MREEIEILSDIRAMYSCFDDSERPYYEALSAGIKALQQEPCIPTRDLSDKELKHFAEEMKKVRPQVIEQEPVLDKIRAEIDKARFIDKDTRHCKNALASGLEVAMKIIDKYKAESEVTDADSN